MSSPTVLSFSTVCALIGIVLVAIAFGTDNWTEFKVNRGEFPPPAAAEEQAAIAKDIFYSRSYGLFRECFPEEVSPPEPKTYISPLGSNCANIRDYQIPEDDQVRGYSEPRKTRMHLMRTTVAFYIVGLAFLFFCLFTGVSGCWLRNPGLVLATGILLLFSTLFLAAAMAVWHGVEYLQREVLDEEPFYRKWPQYLQKASEQKYGWSYMISWIGIGFVLIAAILMLVAYRFLKDEAREEFEKKRAAYMAPNYYDKAAMVPYGYANYGYGYPNAYAYGTYGTYAGAPGNANGYYGYLTYGR